MRVLSLCASDHGGAGRAVRELHEGFRSIGIDSRLFVFDKSAHDRFTIEARSPDLTFKLRRFIAKVMLKLMSRQDFRFNAHTTSPKIAASEICEQVGFVPEVIIAHYVAGFVSFDDVARLQEHSGALVIWHLVDMGMFTGGCHYAWDCRGYEGSCGRCPGLRLPMPRDSSKRVQEQKVEAVRRSNTLAIAGSGLLCEQAARSTVFSGILVHKVLIGVDPARYKQGDRLVARTKSGVPDKRTILFGAQKSNDRRKGYDRLITALVLLARCSEFDLESIQLVTIGRVAFSKKLAENGIDQHHLGTVHDEARLVDIYRAADVLAVPSVQDSGPMMINESLMCGTPVVSFDMGVARDLIESGRNGYVVRLGDAQALADRLREVLDADEIAANELSRQSRRIALERCSIAGQVEEFVQIMERSVVDPANASVADPGGRKSDTER